MGCILFLGKKGRPKHAKRAAKGMTKTAGEAAHLPAATSLVLCSYCITNKCKFSAKKTVLRKTHGRHGGIETANLL